MKMCSRPILIEVSGSRYVFFFFCTLSFFYRNFPKENFEQTQEVRLEILGLFSDNSSWGLCKGKKHLFSCSSHSWSDHRGLWSASDGEDSTGITPVIATPIISSAPPPDSTLGTTTADSSSEHPLYSISADGSVGESVPPSPTCCEWRVCHTSQEGPKISCWLFCTFIISQSALKGILLQQVRQYDCITEGLEVIPGCSFYWAETPDGRPSGYTLHHTWGLCCKISSWNDVIY